MTEDDGHAISYKVLRRGTPVRSADGIEVGKVRAAHEAKREHIFDGIIIDTRNGRRFVDAPEVARIAERWVTLTIDADAIDGLPTPRSVMAERMRMSTTVRRAQRWGRGMRDRWDQRP